MEITVGEHSLLADAVSDEDLEEMVSDLVHLFDLLNVSTDDGFLLLEHSDSSVHLDIHQLLIVKVLQSDWNLVLTLLVEDDLERSGVVVDLEAGAHSLLNLVGNTSDNDDIINSFTLDFADIIWSWLGFLDHLHGDRGEDSVLASLASEVATLVLVSTVEAAVATIPSEVVSSVEATTVAASIEATATIATSIVVAG